MGFLQEYLPQTTAEEEQKNYPKGEEAFSLDVRLEESEEETCEKDLTKVTAPMLEKWQKDPECFWFELPPKRRREVMEDMLVRLTADPKPSSLEKRA